MTRFPIMRTQWSKDWRTATPWQHDGEDLSYVGVHMAGENDYGKVWCLRLGPLAVLAGIFKERQTDGSENG